MHLIFQSNNVDPAWYDKEHRPEHVKDRVLNGSTHGEANKQTQRTRRHPEEIEQDESPFQQNKQQGDHRLCASLQC